MLIARSFDPAARIEIDERWRALGIRELRVSSSPNVIVRRVALPPQAYRLNVTPAAVSIESGDSAGAFYGAMTLAQLARRTGSGWSVPCVRIADAPALRWRMLSDDVSRGPLPTMRYFKERIRTIAAFKMNGYSPMMEQVFVDPHDPLPAPLDGITPAQLHELAVYARRFHVQFVPQQQTFAHMHHTLALEKYAAAAELPHGFLLSPASPISLPYITRLLRDELAAVGHVRFFHIMSDEASMLGEGQSKALVAREGLARVYAQHIVQMNDIVAPSGARIMLWDDGIENDPSIMRLIPHNAVIVNWHYGAQKSFVKYIRLIAGGGFEQFVAPGDSNWNQIYPNLAVALENERRFIREGKAAHVAGLFQTVWNDDGETLFEETWYPVLYAAANAWEQGDVSPARFQRDFPWAFFGSTDARYGTDIADLADAEARVTANPSDSSDYLFWADPFDVRIAARMQRVDLHEVRLEAEDAEQHLLMHAPPLHKNAARVMYLAARRFDLLGRRFQAAAEIRDYYADAQAQLGKKGSRSERDLYWCKYWFWELRDDEEALIPLYAAAWRYEDRSSHLGSNLERYHLEAQRDIRRADRINTETFEDFVRERHLLPLDQVLWPAH